MSAFRSELDTHVQCYRGTKKMRMEHGPLGGLWRPPESSLSRTGAKGRVSGRGWAQVPCDHHSPGPFKPIILFVLISSPKWAPPFLFWVLHPACHGQEGRWESCASCRRLWTEGRRGRSWAPLGPMADTWVLPVCQGEMYPCRQLGRENRGLGSRASSVAFVPCDLEQAPPHPLLGLSFPSSFPVSS